jgi:hypothetical protein
LTFDETAASKFVKESHVYSRIARTRQQTTQTIGPPRFLRQRRERPCDTRARQKPDKLAPPHRRFPVPRSDRGFLGYHRCAVRKGKITPQQAL